MNFTARFHFLKSKIKLKQQEMNRKGEEKEWKNERREGIDCKKGGKKQERELPCWSTALYGKKLQK